MAEPIKAHCNKCLRETNHAQLFREHEHWQDADDRQFFCEGADTYLSLRCLGCDEIHFEHHHWFSEETDPDGGPILRKKHYPPSVIRQKPAWRRSFFPFNLRLNELGSLLDEIYDAYAVGAYRLSVMGIRALAERVMIDQVGDQGTFEKNISKFCADGFVAQIQASLFRDTLIEAGHATMHRNFSPSGETVATLMEIIEGIINVIYYEPLKANEVAKAIPKRPGETSEF